MVTNLDVLSMAQALAYHSTARQNLIAENVANADTVNYRAKDVKPFDEVYRGPGAPSDKITPPAAFTPVRMAAVLPGHFGYEANEPAVTGLGDLGISENALRGSDSPNGNSVALEDQITRGVEAKFGHDMALSVLKMTMDLLRMSITSG